MAEKTSLKTKTRVEVTTKTVGQEITITARRATIAIVHHAITITVRRETIITGTALQGLRKTHHHLNNNK